MQKIIFLVAGMLLLGSCSPGGSIQPTAVSPSMVPPGTAQNISNPTSVPQAGGELPTQPPVDNPAPVVEENTVITAAPALLTTGDISVYIPESWSSTTVEAGSITGIIFANQIPADVQSQEETADSFPAGFASGAVVLSPMPETANSPALFTGMLENIPKYNNEDFQAMLMTADQVGLINLASVETMTLNSARTGELSGHQALVMDGAVQYPDGKGPVLAQVWLSWAGRNFVTFYRFAAEDVSPDDNQELEKIRASIQIPVE